MTEFAIVRAALAPIYGDPALPAPQISQAVLGERLNVLERKEKWVRVLQEDGYSGWVHEGYLQFGDDEWAHAWERGTHGAPTVSLGAELLDDEGRMMMRLPWGARIVRLSQEQYQLPDGRRGSVTAGEVVAVDRLADWFPPRGESVARTARRWMGTPYLWGGVTPAGADCSGLVQAVLWLHGVALPRDSYMQSDKGVAIEAGDDFSQLRAGDLLFYSETGKVNHVAMSLGGSEIIHSSLTNGGVATNDMMGTGDLEKILRAVFVKAQRVLPD